MSSRRRDAVDLHAYVGAEVQVPVSDSGTFEQARTSTECHWKIVVTARSRTGTALRAEGAWRDDPSEMIFRLEPVKD